MVYQMIDGLRLLTIPTIDQNALVVAQCMVTKVLGLELACSRGKAFARSAGEPYAWQCSCKVSSAVDIRLCTMSRALQASTMGVFAGT